MRISENQGRAQLIAIAMLCALLLIWVWATAPGPRGSDQYWYSSYVDQLRLHGRPASNYVTPSAWASEFPPPPVHHIPAVYAAYAFGLLGLSSYWSWQASNLLFVAVGLFCFYRAVRVRLRAEFALWATVLAASFPLTFWVAANPLSEASLYACGGVMALGFALRQGPRRTTGAALVLASATIMTITRQNHVILLVGLAIAFFASASDWRGRISIGGMAALCLAMLLLRERYLPTYPTVGGIPTLLMTPAKTVDFGGTPALFATSPAPFDLRAWAGGAVRNLLDPVLVGPCVALGLLLLWARRTGSALLGSDASVLLLLSIATMVATAAVFQFQFRYWSGLYLPCALVLTNLASSAQQLSTRARAVALASAVLLLAATGGMAFKVRADALGSVRQRAQIAQFAQQNLPAGASLMVWDAWGIRFAYELSGTRIVLASTALQSGDEIAQAMRRFRVGVVLVRRSSQRGMELAASMRLRPLPPVESSDPPGDGEFAAFGAELPEAPDAGSGRSSVDAGEARPARITGQ
ncbi:MAG: hypothetical protein U0625_01500 [Phycisphaerales bacterium]